MPTLQRALNLYLNVTLAYGLAHALPSAWSYKTSMYSTGYHAPKKELLFVDKTAMVFASTVSTPVLWPILLRDDLIRVECLVRGKPIRDYLPASDDP